MKAPIPSKKVALGGDHDPVAIEEQVRARAYELFEVRGRETGHELEDWLRAEEEVTGRKSGATSV